MIDRAEFEALHGAGLHDQDGHRVGDITRVYVDDVDGRITWAVVKTGMLGTKQRFVPLADATFVDGSVAVPFDRSVIKDAPDLAVDGNLDRDEESALYAYYGVSPAASIEPAPVEPVPVEPAPVEQFPADPAPVEQFTADPATVEPATVDPAPVEPVPADPSPAEPADPSTSEPLAGRHADDQVMTRSEEALVVDTEQQETERVTLTRHVVTEEQTVTVPLTREEVRIVREPATGATAEDGVDLGPDEQVVVLHEERPVVTTEVHEVERVRIERAEVTEDEDVTGEVRREVIDVERSPADAASDDAPVDHHEGGTEPETGVAPRP